jgi:uncharacterized protein YndB with AHSA1/START domain
MTERVEREALLTAPRWEVWRALTEPERLADWLADEAELDLRPGGDVALRLLDGTERTGFVEAAEAPARLALWWRDPDEEDGGELTRVEVVLSEARNGTLLRVVESRPLAALGRSAGPVALAGAGR